MSNNFFTPYNSARPAGAASNVSAMSMAPYSSVGEVMPAGLAAKHGQPARFTAHPNPNDNYSSVIHDLRDFREGLAITTQTVLERLVVEAPEWAIRKLYPIERTDRIEIEASVWEFNHGALPHVPEQGTYRVLSSRRRTKRGRMARRGIGLDLETTSLLTSGGVEQQNRMLAGLAIVVIESAIMDVAWEITEEGEKHLSNATAFAGTHGSVTNPLQQASAERSVAFAVHKNPQRFVTLTNMFMKELASVRGVSGPYALIVPADFRLNLDPSNRMLGKGEGYTPGVEMMRSTFSSDGPTLTFPNGVEVYQLPELHIYDRPAAGDVRAELFQMLARTRVFAEYYQMCFGGRRDHEFYDGITCFDRNKLFKSSQRDIVLYDVQKDTYVRIAFIDALRLAHGSRVQPVEFTREHHFPTRGTRGAPWFYAWNGSASVPVQFLGEVDTNCLQFKDLRQHAQSKLARLASGMTNFESEMRGVIERAKQQANEGLLFNEEEEGASLETQRLRAFLEELKSTGEFGDIPENDLTQILIGPGFEVQGTTDRVAIGASMSANGALPAVTMPYGPMTEGKNEFAEFTGGLSAKNTWPTSPIGLHIIQDGNVALIASNDVAACAKLGPQQRIMASAPLPLVYDLSKIARVAEGAGADGADAMTAWAKNVESNAKDHTAKQQFIASLIDGTKIADIGAEFTADDSARVVAEVKRQAGITKKADVGKVVAAYKGDARLGEPSSTISKVAEDFANAKKFIGHRGTLSDSAIDDVAAHVGRIRAAAKKAANALPKNRIGYVVLPGTLVSTKAGAEHLHASSVEHGIDLTTNNPKIGGEINTELDEMHSTMTRALSSVQNRVSAISGTSDAGASKSARTQLVSLEKARQAIRDGKVVIDPSTKKPFDGKPEDLRFASDMHGYVGEKMTFNGFKNIVGARLAGAKKTAVAPKKPAQTPSELRGIAPIGAQIVLRESEFLSDVNAREGSAAENMHRHFENAQKEHHPLLRLLMTLSLIDRVIDEEGSFTPMYNAVENNVHVPVNVLLFAPFMTYVMDTFSLLKYGPETGKFFYGFPALMQGNDVSNQTTMTTFSIWMRAFTIEGKNIINIPFMRCRRVIGGCGTEFFSRERFTEEVSQDGDGYARRSLIAVSCCIMENTFPEFISPAGKFTFGDHLTESMGKYHFSSARYESKISGGWKMKRFYSANGFNPDAGFGTNPTMPEVAMQGQVVTHNGDGFKGLIVNNAHRGSNSCFRGAAKVLNGPDTYFIPDKDVTATILRDVAAVVG